MLMPPPPFHAKLSLSAQQQAPLTQLLSDGGALMKGQGTTGTYSPARLFLDPPLGAVRARQPLSYSDWRWQDLKARPPSSPSGPLLGP